MYIFILVNNEREIELGVFDSFENCDNFAKLLPGYFLDNFDEPKLDLKDFPEYVEINFLNNIIPLTKHMFEDNTIADIYFKEIPKLDDKQTEKTMIDYECLVDSYYCNSLELKEYVKKRNNNFKIVKEKLESMLMKLKLLSVDLKMERL